MAAVEFRWYGVTQKWRHNHSTPWKCRCTFLLGFNADVLTCHKFAFSPCACVDFSLWAPVSSSRLKTCTRGQAETQLPHASCDDWWLSRAYSCWNPIPACAQSCRILPVGIMFVFFLFFLRLLFFYFEKTFLSEGVSKYIYLKCAQAEWVSFILFLSHIAHTPVTETWCTRHFNVLVLADPYRLLSQCQDTGWVSHICCNFFLPSPKKEKKKKKHKHFMWLLSFLL